MEHRQEAYRRKQDKLYKELLQNRAATLESTGQLKACQTSYILISMLLTASVVSALPSRREPVCHKPSGGYQDSCQNVNIEPYQSQDLRVPASCKLEADCKTIYAEMKPTHNTVFLPSNTQLKDIANNNGTLIYQGKPLQQHNTSGGSTANCVAPTGSYSKSCKVTPKAYRSTDPNLKNTALCEAEADCEKLTGNKEASVVYYNLKAEDESSIEKIENCDGMLVVHADDHRCQDASQNDIQELAKTEGQRTVKL